jgi:hypothetical protein
MFNARRPNRTLQPMAPKRWPARELRTMIAAPQARGAFATGALAVGGFALGAIAVGAVAVGALAIGRLAVGRARIGRLEIDELSVRRLLVTEELQAPPSVASERSTQQVAEQTFPLSSPSQ